MICRILYFELTAYLPWRSSTKLQENSVLAFYIIIYIYILFKNKTQIFANVNLNKNIKQYLYQVNKLKKQRMSRNHCIVHNNLIYLEKKHQTFSSTSVFIKKCYFLFCCCICAESSIYFFN